MNCFPEMIFQKRNSSVKVFTKVSNNLELLLSGALKMVGGDIVFQHEGTVGGLISC